MEQATGAPINNGYRRFGVGDALIVLAGIAVAFSILADTPEILPHISLYISRSDALLFRNLLDFMHSFSGVLATLLCVASATILVLNLKGRRPPISDLARQPGFMASATIMLILILGFLLAVKTFTFSRLAYPDVSASYMQPRQLTIQFLFMMPIPTALAILASWLTLILNRRWSPQPTWLDRAGRAVAWAWLILAIL